MSDAMGLLPTSLPDDILHDLWLSMITSCSRCRWRTTAGITKSLAVHAPVAST